MVHQNNELVKRFVDIMTMSGKSVDRYNKLMQVRTDQQGRLMNYSQLYFIQLKGKYSVPKILPIVAYACSFS